MKITKSAVLFDLDGVTIDTEPLYTIAEIRLFHDYGVDIPRKDWGLFRGCSEERFFELSIERYGISEDRDIFIKKGRQYVMDEFNKNIPFIPGFKSLIKRIGNSHVTGLVTASPLRSLEWIRDKIGLDNYFQYIISGEETDKNKPHPHPYLKMMSRIDVRPKNTVIIEDSIPGLRSALASGGHVIALKGSVPLEKLQIAHRIVTHLDEITLKFINDLLVDSI
jgi:HAD superfamily hydrolase (TIGR01509 family)